MIMLQATINLMPESIITVYVMNHIYFFMFAGLLSYNIPLVFKLKSEPGFILRACCLSLMSLLMLVIAMYAPSKYSIDWQITGWVVCFVSGLVLSVYGSRIFHAKFAGLISRFTVKSSIRQGAATDIRYMDDVMPNISDYNPLDYIDISKGIFVGLDENVKPIYLEDMDNWYMRHFLIVGSTRSGKGVAMQSLGIQSLMIGETVVFLDPKGDTYLPGIFKQQCNELNLPYNYIDLTSNEPQINLIADFDERDLKNCFIEAFSMRERGAESDVYRKIEQEFLENLAKFICYDEEQNKSLLEMCDEFGIYRYSDKNKASVSDLNKLCNIGSVNAASGRSLSELLHGGGCIYIVGDLLDETMKKLQRFIFCRIAQLTRNQANYVEQYGGNKMQVTVFADELIAHISRFVTESYTVTLGWGLKIVSAIQDLKLLKGAPADIDPEFLIGAVFGNSQNKLFYRADDIDTADYLSAMTGEIRIEEEQMTVKRNSLHSEQLNPEIKISQSKRNLIDRNMILRLRQFEAVFCSSLEYRSAIACLCKTSPVKAPKGVNGKQIQVVKTAVAEKFNSDAFTQHSNPLHEVFASGTVSNLNNSGSSWKPQDNNDNESNKDESTKPKRRRHRNAKPKFNSATNAEHNTNGAQHAQTRSSSKPTYGNRPNGNQTSSTKKSDYLL